MLRRFSRELETLPLNDPGVSSIASRWKLEIKHPVSEPVPQMLMVAFMNQLKQGYGIQNKMNGINETETVRVKLCLVSSPQHDEANQEIGNQKGIKFLDHADRF